MKTTSIKKIEKVSMGSGGNSMVVIVDGEPFVEITVRLFFVCCTLHAGGLPAVADNGRVSLRGMHRMFGAWLECRI